MAAGSLIHGVRWIADTAGRIVGYRNPVSDKDEDLNAAPIQALVSGAWIRAINLPGSTAGVYADQDVPLQVGCTARPVWVTYIDAVNGNDAWDGSQPAFTSGSSGPKQTPNIASWTGTKTSWFTDEVLLFRAGALTREVSATVEVEPGVSETVTVRCGMVHTCTLTGSSLALTTRKHLGAYWLPADDRTVRPVFRSLNSAGTGAARCVVGAAGTLSQISVSDIIFDAQDVANRNGLSFYDFADGHTINNVTVANCAAIGGTVDDNYSGIKVQYFGQYARTTAYGVSKQILIVGCDVVGWGGHGFATNGTLGEQLSNGRWHGCDIVNCRAVGCGGTYDTHGFTAYSGGVSNGWAGTWTLVSGNVYSRSMSAQYGRNVPDIEQVFTQATGSSEMFQLVKNTSTPTTPADGEFGFDVGTQLLYVNKGSAVGAGELFSTVVRACKGVRRINCQALGQRVPVPSITGKLEGHGFAFDDFTSDCADINCRSQGNAGHGWTINRGNNNRIIQPFIRHNVWGSVKGNFGWGHLVTRGYLEARGFSDTLPPNKGAVHIAHASRRNLSGAANANALGSTISACDIRYVGADATVALLYAATSVGSPMLVADNCAFSPGVGPLTAGNRVHVRGLLPAIGLVPVDAAGLAT